jgi:hypothetical protein
MVTEFFKRGKIRCDCYVCRDRKSRIQQLKIERDQREASRAAAAVALEKRPLEAQQTTRSAKKQKQRFPHKKSRSQS